MRDASSNGCGQPWLGREALSRKLLLPALRLQQFLRRSRRPVALARRHALALRAKSAAWDEESKRHWVLERLRLTVREAARSTAHYAELFAKIGFDPKADFAFDEFACIPILEKSDLLNDSGRLLSSTVCPKRRTPMSTGGSTGLPVTVFLGPEEEGWATAGIEFQMESLNVPIGCRTVQFWGHNLDLAANDTIPERLMNLANNRRWIDCFRLSPDHLDQVHEFLQEWQPDCIVAYASALGALAERVLDRGYKANYPKRCFVTGAEKLDCRHREQLRRAFRRPVHEQYGSRDVGLMAWQVNPERSLEFRVNWESVLIEPETATENSPILITKLHADAMPMIRYRVGDEGRFPAGSRPGYPALHLSEVLGRITEKVWLPDGRFIHGLQFPHLLKDFPVGEFMVRQREDYSVEVQLAPKPDFSPEHRQRIMATIIANLPGIPIVITLKNTIPRTAVQKWRPVMSDVKHVGDSKGSSNERVYETGVSTSAEFLHR